MNEMQMNVIENNQRQLRKAIVIYEEGRRVHAWKLMHDIYVSGMGNFGAYWERALQERQP